jgi:hypothetical protein
MIQDPVRRSRVKRTLLIIIIATIPCYLLGGIVLLVNEGISGRATPSAPSATIEQVDSEISATPSPTLPIPTAIFPTRTETMTPTISLTPTITRTYVIPTSTPSHTPTSTATEPPPPDTPTPTTEPPPGEN